MKRSKVIEYCALKLYTFEFSLQQLEPPSPAPDLPEDRRSKRLKTSRQAWESEETTDNEDILDRFLKVKQFADHRIPSYESKFPTYRCFIIKTLDA